MVWMSVFEAAICTIIPPPAAMRKMTESHTTRGEREGDERGAEERPGERQRAAEAEDGGARGEPQRAGDGADAGGGHQEAQGVRAAVEHLAGRRSA